ncbi:MAG: alkaline phosphatase D family protein [Verrucomicrobiota bacterium]
MKAIVIAALLATGISASGAEAPLSRIAFGSCINKTNHAMLDRTLTLPFDLFVFLGDNIYADTADMQVMKAKYRALRESSFFQGLLKKAPFAATWDDHDYGVNDGGADYPKKVEAQQIFLDTFNEPANAPRRKRPGVYDARVFGPPGKRVQVILLDTRYFRSPLKRGDNKAEPSGGPYVPNPSPEVTMLGEAQWSWLETQLKQPAELRLVASSIQFISEFSGAEAWANMPLEKKRLLALIQKTRANGVMIVSGDRHWAELSKMDSGAGYPLYDMTSSALTQKHPRGTPTPNIYREGPTWHEANVGLLHIDWEQKNPPITIQVIDEQGTVRIEKQLRLSDLQSRQ